MQNDLNSKIVEYYKIAKKITSVENLEIYDEDSFSFYNKNDDCKVTISYNDDSKSVIMYQEYDNGNMDDDEVSLLTFKNYLSKKKMANGGMMAKGGMIVAQKTFDINDNEVSEDIYEFLLDYTSDDFELSEEDQYAIRSEDPERVIDIMNDGLTDYEVLSRYDDDQIRLKIIKKTKMAKGGSTMKLIYVVTEIDPDYMDSYAYTSKAKADAKIEEFEDNFIEFEMNQESLGENDYLLVYGEEGEFTVESISKSNVKSFLERTDNKYGAILDMKSGFAQCYSGRDIECKNEIAKFSDGDVYKKKMADGGYMAKGGETKEFIDWDKIIGKKVNGWEARDNNGISILWENDNSPYWFYATPGWENEKNLPIQIVGDGGDFGIAMFSKNEDASYELNDYLMEIKEIIRIINFKKPLSVSDFKNSFSKVINNGDSFKKGGYMAKGGMMSDEKMTLKLQKEFEGKDLFDDEIVDEYVVKQFDYSEDDDKIEKFIRMKKNKFYVVPFDNQDDSYYYILVPKDKMAKGGATSDIYILGSNYEIRRPMNVDDDDLAKALKKYKVEMYFIDEEGYGDAFIKLIGQKDNIENLLKDFNVWNIDADELNDLYLKIKKYKGKLDPKYNASTYMKQYYEDLYSDEDYARGGKTKSNPAKFRDKVKAISKKLAGTKVPKKYKKDYGATYDKQEANTAARRISGAKLAELKAKLAKKTKTKRK